jgi:hypothetical protein
MPRIGEQFIDGSDMPDPVKQGLGMLISSALGAAVGGTQGMAMGFNVDTNNRQLHESEKAKIKRLAKGDKALEQLLTDAACYLVNCSGGRQEGSQDRADLQAVQDRVAAQADTVYKHALDALKAEQGNGLFVYTSFDQGLDRLNATDPRNTGTADRAEIERSVAALNARALAQQCASEQCINEALTAVQALDETLKRSGVPINDSTRLGLKFDIAGLLSAKGDMNAVLSALALMGNINRADSAGQPSAIKSLEEAIAKQLGHSLTQGQKLALENVVKNVEVPSAAGSTTSGGTANAATGPKLAEQLSNESLAASGANMNNIKVVAEGKINGQVYIDTNQTARSATTANASEPTLVPPDRVAAREAQGLGNVNGNMSTAHAEIGVIQQASNAGVARGADMTLTVKGEKVCDFCRGDIPAAAQAAGLKSLEIVDVAAGVTYYWSPGMTRLKPRKQ